MYHLTQGGLSTGQTNQIQHTVHPVYLILVCCRLVNGAVWLLFCLNYAQKLNKMDQLKAYVKFIYILGDVAFPQTP